MEHNTQNSKTAFGEGRQINFRALLDKMRSNWYWFVIAIITTTASSFLFLRYTAPTYKASAKVLIKNDEKALAGEDALAQAFGGQFGSSKSVEGEAEVLKTNFLMTKVVESLESYISYYHKGQIRSVNLYDNSPFRVELLFSPDSIKPIDFDVKITGNIVEIHNDSFIKTVSFGRPFEIPNFGKLQIEKVATVSEESMFTVKIRGVKETAAAYLHSLTVTIPVKQVSIIQLEFTHEVPKLSEDLLSELIRTYSEVNLNDKNQIADSTIAFIENRLIYVGSELGDIEGDVQQFKQKNSITDISAQSNELITVTSNSMEELAKVETQLSVIKSVEQYLNDAQTNERVIPSGLLLEDPSFAALVEHYNALVLEKEKAGLSQTEKNPYVKNLNNQIAGLRSDMILSLRNVQRSLEISRQRTLERYNKIKGQVRDIPAIERNYLDLARQQQIKQELYVFLMQKREETAISKTANISNTKVIEPATAIGPISPVHRNVYGYGLILGFIIPFTTIFLKDRLNTRVVSRDQVTSATQAPIIGEIGTNDIDSEALVVTQSSRSPIAEQFRALRTNLAFFLKENQKTILFTSSMSGEGKSFITLNLSSALAISGKKIIALELDLRKPGLSGKIKMNNEFGFTNFVVNKSLRPNEIIKKSGIHENLFIISSGSIPPNPTELILSERTSELFTYLKEQFDYIIIDAPPIGMVTDAQLLSKYADLTMYVVRQGFTYKEQLQIPEDVYVNKKMKQISLIVNDVKSDSSYGYGFGYGYGYGYGYSENVKSRRNKSFFARLFSKQGNAKN